MQPDQVKMYAKTSMSISFSSFSNQFFIQL